ncbi:Gfo/Idh/MocA family protein [Flavicella sediminum]|uniref:Gfo/Idh/MocA family protein n=1 Tax=Flavicella sediminum TaxID=2585141 RepID=UPI00111E9E68|nr:Gfo/Idh/MocA family oxidoreductase [Flavicella sediminum]
MSQITRRSFIKSTTALSIGTLFIPNLLRSSPNSRLKFAVIGVGGRGGSCWNQVPKEDIVAMCDVDDRMTAKGDKACPDAKKYKDFRIMFDEMAKDIDAVIIATPDHTHFPAAMAAMELGKHVFVEKPLAHNIWQLRTLKKAAAYYGVISQMGNQGHTTDGIRSIKEYYDAGILGEVKEVIAWQPKVNVAKSRYFANGKNADLSAQQIPAELNWDAWLGPIADRPYNELYVPRKWRSFYDMGHGQLGDWFCHTLDAPFWSLDLGIPHTITGERKDAAADHSYMPSESKVTWEFAERKGKAPVKMEWIEGYETPEVRPEWGINKLPKKGMIMIGDKQTLITGGRPDTFKLIMPDEEWNEFQKNAPEKTIPRVQENKPVLEWIDAIKNHRLPGSNFNYATKFNEMGELGVLAQRFGGTINYDAHKMKAVGRPELDIYIKEPARKGWSYGEGLLDK